MEITAQALAPIDRTGVPQTDRRRQPESADALVSIARALTVAPTGTVPGHHRSLAKGIPHARCEHVN